MGRMDLDQDPDSRGRPSLSGERGKSPRINFRMSDELYRLAQQRAEAEEVSVSEIARRALEHYLER